MMEEFGTTSLKKCFDCGGMPSLLFDSNKNAWYVQCSNKGCVNCTAPYKDPEDALKHWDEVN